MSNNIIISDCFVELSDEEQQMVSGGQISPIGNVPRIPLGQGNLEGTETIARVQNVRGITNSGPLGSFGNSLADGTGFRTGAQDLMGLPPDFESSETGR